MINREVRYVNKCICMGYIIKDSSLHAPKKKGKKVSPERKGFKRGERTLFGTQSQMNEESDPSLNTTNLLIPSHCNFRPQSLPLARPHPANNSTFHFICTSILSNYVPWFMGTSSRLRTRICICIRNKITSKPQVTTTGFFHAF